MTFGQDYGDVVDHQDCPRCNSPAVVRSRKYGTAESRLYQNNLTCPKCHYVEFVGMMTLERMLDQKRLNRFKVLREKSRTPRERRRLDERIAEVERQMVLHDVIKWPERRKVEHIPVTEAWNEKDSATDGEEAGENLQAPSSQEDSRGSQS